MSINPQYAVSRAVKTGVLPRLDGTILCVDCGNAATEYEHRDYSKPLAVEPVCHGCNMKRGRGRNHTQWKCTLRVTSAEKRKIVAAAKSARRKLSDWLRVVAVDAADGKRFG